MRSRSFRWPRRFEHRNHTPSEGGRQEEGFHWSEGGLNSRVKEEEIVRRRVLSLIMVLALLAGVLSGCTSKEPTAQSPQAPQAKKEPAKIKFFTGKVETVDLMNELIAK